MSVSQLYPLQPGTHSQLYSSADESSAHVAPCLHGALAHSAMSMLHTSPSKPARQEQEKLSTDPRSEHAAPLAHGELSHSLNDRHYGRYYDVDVAISGIKKQRAGAFHDAALWLVLINERVVTLAIGVARLAEAPVGVH